MHEGDTPKEARALLHKLWWSVCVGGSMSTGRACQSGAATTLDKSCIRIWLLAYRAPRLWVANYGFYGFFTVHVLICKACKHAQRVLKGELQKQLQQEIVHNQRTHAWTADTNWTCGRSSQNNEKVKPLVELFRRHFFFFPKASLHHQKACTVGVNGCLSWNGPVMDGWPLLCVPDILPGDSWDTDQPPHNLEQDEARSKKRLDGDS